MVESLAVWRITRNQFKQKSLKITLYRNWNCSAPKTGTHVNKVSYDRQRAFLSFSRKGLIWFEVWFKHWNGLMLKVKLLFLNYYYFFLLLFLKFFWYSTLYVMDLFRFGPTFSPFYCARLPIYKRVVWARLAGPSHMYFSLN